MDHVRIGLIGYGNMGSAHARTLGELPELALAAIADTDPAARDRAKQAHPGVPVLDTAEALLDQGGLDAVLIATPHYDHPPLAIAAFERGLHVLTEKPLAVTAKAAQQAIDAHAQHPQLVFAGMFQQRTNPIFRMAKRLIDEGRLGTILRASWTITNWFRTQAYYDSGGWRATWAGEGGGVLINQCPHNLDLYTWLAGSPRRVTALARLGHYHDIEVEDDVTAIVEFEHGATGVFATTTGEAPGINRLEIAGDKATLIASASGPLKLLENDGSCIDFCKTSPELFATPAVSRSTIEVGGRFPEHRGILENFAAAVLRSEPLIAPAAEGIRGLELGNAMLMSGLTGKPVDLPTDRDAFDALLRDLAARSTRRKPAPASRPAGPVDMSKSY